MPGSGKHNVNNIDSFFKVRPSRTTIREGETISFLEKGKLVKQEKRNGVVYETIYVEQGTQETRSTTTTKSTSSSGDITSVTAGTGLSGGGVSGPVTLNIDSTVTTLTGTQTLTNKTLTAPTFTGTAQGASLTLTGDLTVQGDTTTLNTATLQVEDKNIVLNYHASNDTSSSAEGAGITIQDAVNASTDATILWDQVPGEFDFSHAINVTGNISVSGTVDGVDIAARDHDEVSLSGSLDYLTISGQTITRNAINLGTDVTSQLPLSNGGTGATNATTARENLGLEIGLDVQAYDAGLLSIAGLTTAANKMIYTTASDTYAVTDLTSTARALLDDTSTTAMRTTLGVDAAGTDNSTDVTIAAGKDYITINESTQVITLGTIDIGDDTNLVGGTGITLTGDTLSTTDSEIVHDNLNGYVENEHKDHSSISITAGAGLSGGGDITASRGLALDISSLDAQTPALTLSDKVAIYDTDVSENNVATLTQLKAIVNTDTNTNQLTTFDVSGDSGTDQTISHGNTLTISGGNGITTSTSATDILSVALGGFSSLTSQSSPAEQDLVVIEEAIGGAIKKVQVGALTSSGISFNGSTANGLLTYGNSTTADVESNLTFSGGVLSIDNDDVNEGGQISLLPGTGHTSTYHIDNFYGHLRFFSSATAGEQFRLTSGGDLAQLTGTKHYFDGVGHTYIQESSDDILKFYVGGVNLLSMIEGGTNVVKVGDGTYLGVGDSTDLFMYHSSGNSFINNGTGNLTIRNQTDDGDIIFQTDNGSGGYTNYLQIDGGAENIYVYKDLRLAATKKLYLDGGGNSYIQEESADNLIFRAAGGNYLRITGSNIVLNDPGASYDVRIEGNNDGNLFFADGSADRVGIGTNSPSKKLEVAGDVRIASGGDLILSDSGGGNDTFLYNDSQSLIGYINGAERFRVNSSGNVGIGTNSPSELLDINDRIHLKSDGTIHWGSAANHGVLSWDTGRAIVSAKGTNNLDLKASSGYSVVVNETGSNVDFRVEGDTHTNLIFADASKDNVGIHNGSPWTSTYLDVGGADTSANMRIGNGIYFYDSNRFISRNGNHIDFTSTNGTMQMRDGVSVYNKYASGSGDQRNTYNHFAHKVAANQAGAFICNTDIPRASNRMTILHFEGYAYGDASVIDFKVCFYPYSGSNGQDGVAGRPINYSIVDNGNDGRQKFIGVNSSGNIAVAIGDYNDPNKYYWHYHVNILQGHSDADLGSWTGTASTTDGFGWLDKRTVYAPFFVKEEGSNHQSHHRVTIGAGNEGNTFRTDSGFIKLGPTNSGWGHIETDRASFYFNKRLTVDEGIVQSYDEDLILRRANSSADRIDIAADYTRVIVNNSEKFRVNSSGVEVASGNSGGDGALDSPTIRINNTTESSDWDSGDVVGTLEWYASDTSGNAPYVTSFIKSVNPQNNGTLPGGYLSFGTCPYNQSGGATEEFRMETDGDFHAKQDVVAFSTTPSDKRLKTNIKDINYGLNTIMSLNPKQYDWKEDNRHDIGFIAQEVEEVIPEIVKDKKHFDKEIKTLDYEKLTAVLIKAVQEQQEQINELKEKLNG
jgi:hypothetical protein